MSRYLSVAFVIAYYVTVARGFLGVTPTEPFNYSNQVDTTGNFILFWKFNDTHITFEVHVKTYGYVGFGLSDSGKMYPADVVVGWVKDGVTHFKDYHTTAHAPPVLDKQQDWFLLHGEENDFGTVLKFVRKLDTCDEAEDKKIEDGTIRLIYSYHPRDPASSENLLYHGPEHRGTKSLSLLSVSSIQARISANQDDVKTYDFLNGNFIIPAANTTYNCRVFRMPNISGKHHMIKVEPIITPGNELLVHHMVIYRCSGIDPKFDGINYMCFGDIPQGLQQCYHTIIAWAIGGQAFYYPEHVGVSVGAPDDPDVYIIETHYDNPAKKSGVIDNSGLRITLTRNIRQHEADMIQMGHQVDWTQTIPPFEKVYPSQAYCAPQCIDHGLGNLTEIKAFAIFQHAHLLGRAIKTRHFRNGTELPPLAIDSNYDFDFQQTRPLRSEIPIRHGDSFIVECRYDTTGKTEPTLGGLSTQNEMCASFILYYPKMELKNCISSPTYDSISNDVTKIKPLLEAYNWTSPQVREVFREKLRDSSILHTCQGDTMVPQILKYTFHETPPKSDYTPPVSSCP
ncbi:hypothetical protein ACJMK2_039735 [Sinanodonta woodiana]|uniref:DOMON domain-containing protein n=1 Tax=Sinanodonta woodiana TaxID=1069815 RepID=A0ABD3WCX5_SINWO